MQVRDSLNTLSCGKVDSAMVLLTMNRLLAFDTNMISYNIHKYYRDLGWCYYLLGNTRNDTSLIRTASHLYDQALYHHPNWGNVLWDKSFFAYHYYHDCEEGKYYLDRYKKATRRKYWNKEQIALLTKNCP